MSSNQKSSRLFDVRCIARNIRYQLINREDVKTHLESLPDVSAKAITLGEVEAERSIEIQALQERAAAKAKAAEVAQANEAQISQSNEIDSGIPATYGAAPAYGSTAEAAAHQHELYRPNQASPTAEAPAAQPSYQAPQAPSAIAQEQIHASAPMVPGSEPIAEATSYTPAEYIHQPQVSPTPEPPSALGVPPMPQSSATQGEIPQQQVNLAETQAVGTPPDPYSQAAGNQMDSQPVDPPQPPAIPQDQPNTSFGHPTVGSSDPSGEDPQ